MSEALQFIDTPYSLVGRVAALKAKGIAGAIRYISPNTANFPHKRLTAAEIAEAAAHGFWLGVVWEVTGSLAEMTAATGKIHAGLALQVAHELKIPTGVGIGFAVDFDAGPPAFPNVKTYFTPAHFACSAEKYLVTGYGDLAVLNMLYAAGLIHYKWRAGAGGWMGNRFATGAVIDQTNAGDVNVAGLPVDLDVLMGTAATNPAAAGLWLPKAA